MEALCNWKGTGPVRRSRTKHPHSLLITVQQRGIMTSSHNKQEWALNCRTAWSSTYPYKAVSQLPGPVALQIQGPALQPLLCTWQVLCMQFKTSTGWGLRMYYKTPENILAYWQTLASLNGNPASSLLEPTQAHNDRAFFTSFAVLTV